MKFLTLAVMLIVLASACEEATDTAEAARTTTLRTNKLSNTASAVTGPPADMTNVNSLHNVLRIKHSKIRFGTHADPSVITLGPTDAGIPVFQPYKGKNSMNIVMPLNTAVLAPLDMKFVGFDNRSAHRREGQTPYDDLELCFESISPDWPDMIICVYHLRTSPLLPGHLVNEECGLVEEWTGSKGSNSAGRIMFLENETFFGEDTPAGRDPEPCKAKIGIMVKRGEIIGYSGQVGNNPHIGFRFKVRSKDQNPITTRGDPYLHWVQPSVFFYWQCFEPDSVFQAGVLAYPFDCEPIQPLLALSTTVDTTVAPTTVTLTDLFKPLPEKRNEMIVE